MSEIKDLKELSHNNYKQYKNKNKSYISKNKDKKKRIQMEEDDNGKLLINQTYNTQLHTNIHQSQCKKKKQIELLLKQSCLDYASLYKMLQKYGLRSLNQTDNPNIVVGSFDDLDGANRLKKEQYNQETEQEHRLVIDIDYQLNKINQLNFKNIQTFQEFSPMEYSCSSDKTNTSINQSQNDLYSPHIEYTQKTPIENKTDYSDINYSNSIDKQSPMRLTNKLNQNEKDKNVNLTIQIDNQKKGNDQNKTTLMIRNIPNRLSQTILLNQIDEKFLGCQDFFYMPIDKDSQANMGQAFINLTQQVFVIEFYNLFNHYKWPHACSNKICEVSFARIQGYQNLCETFQKPNKTLSEKLPKPNIYAYFDEGIYYKELPITVDSQYKLYKRVINHERIQYMKIAQSLQDKKNIELRSNIFDKVWPSVQQEIRERINIPKNVSSQEQEEINQPYFKDLCFKVQCLTEQQMNGVRNYNYENLDNLKSMINYNYDHNNLQINENIEVPPGFHN